jgi:hypothetical protein
MTKDKYTPGSAILRAVDTGLTAAVSSIPGGPVASKVVTQLIHAAEHKVLERNTRKFEDWLHEVAASLQHASPDATVQRIEDHIDEPWAHGPLEDAVRAIRDGIDEAALCYLARLAAWQIRDQVSPDRWSRRAVGLLLDCDAPMVAALLHFVENLSTHWPREVGNMVRIAIGGPFPGAFDVVQIASLHGRIVSTPIDEQSWRPQRLYAELFSLLRAYQFATEEGGRFAHEGKMLMRHHEAVYLVRLFLGSVAASKFPGTEGKVP